MTNQCNFEPCYREARSKGLCMTHYGQQRRGKELTPIKRYRKVVGGKKECGKCGLVKSTDEFYVFSGKYLTNCKVCMNAASTAYHRAKQMAGSVS